MTQPLGDADFAAWENEIPKCKGTAHRDWVERPAATWMVKDPLLCEHRSEEWMAACNLCLRILRRTLAGGSICQECSMPAGRTAQYVPIKGAQ